MTVLVLAQERDAPTDRVVRALGERGVPVFRADLRWFPSQLTFASRLDRGRWRGAMTTGHRAVELSAIRSVWYRDPGRFAFSAQMTPTEQAHAFTEARLGIGGVLSSLDVPWMNDPNRACDAMYKPRQLAVAARCGLPVPRTLVTNFPAAVVDFARTGTGLVQKTFGSNVVATGDRRLVHYTRRLSDPDADDLAGVSLTAHQFQEWVDKDHEVRAVVVGEQVFAVAIRAGSPAARTDWRADYAALTYDLVTLPDDVTAALHRYLRHFGLTYAAVDLVVDRDGRHVFLESNSAGQYGWLEAATGAPITAAVADTLAGPP